MCWWTSFTMWSRYRVQFWWLNSECQPIPIRSAWVSSWRLLVRGDTRHITAVVWAGSGDDWWVSNYWWSEDTRTPALPTGNDASRLISDTSSTCPLANFDVWEMFDILFDILSSFNKLNRKYSPGPNWSCHPFPACIWHWLASIDTVFILQWSVHIPSQAFQTTFKITFIKIAFNIWLDRSRNVYTGSKITTYL